MKHDPSVLLNFPDHFLWGAASSAHQIEGGNHNQWSVWELENAKVLAEKAKFQARYLPKWDEIKKEATNPANYVSGLAADHYHRYEEDFAILKKLHMNAWRFSIEWSRLEPEEGVWNAKEIAHYRNYLERLAQLGIEPIVTLWHWTQPIWFEQKGGFTRRSNIHHFLRYVDKVMRELGHHFRYVITFNEIDTYIGMGFLLAEHPPQNHNRAAAAWTLLNLLSAHKRAYRLIHSMGRKYQVSITKNSAHHYGGDDAWLSRTAAQFMRYFEDYFIMNRLRKHLDFIGLNFYFSNRYLGYRVHNPERRRSDVGWFMQPGDIEHVIKDLYDRYNKPIIVTENGLADRDDEYRKWWLVQTLQAIHRAVQAGVRVDGYLHWSLTDNFEFASGFWPRFGLVAINYETQKRTLRPSAVWLGKLLGRMRE